MKLLIATDLSPASPVLKAVLDRPWPRKTEARLLHVVELPLAMDAIELIEAAKQAAASVLETLAEQLKKAGIATETDVLVGTAWHAIVEQAKKSGADLIVVGSHTRSGIKRFLLGTVAQSVLRSASCSVEVVRSRPDVSPAKTGMRILLGTDGSDCAAAAVQSVAARPWPANSSIRLVSVVPQYVPMPNTVPDYWNALSTEQIKRLEEHGRACAREAIARARKTLSQFGMKEVAAEILLGDPKLAILDAAEAWKADLIALGSHGFHGIDRLLIGSVSESVAVHATCSVEVIRQAI